MRRARVSDPHIEVGPMGGPVACHHAAGGLPGAWLGPAMAGPPLEEVLDQLPVGVLLVGAPSGSIRYANQRAEELLGRGSLFDIDDPITFDQLPAYGPSGLPMPREDRPLTRALAGEGPVRQELAFARRDGRLVVTTVTAAPLRRGDGCVVGAVLVLDAPRER